MPPVVGKCFVSLLKVRNQQFPSGETKFSKAASEEDQREIHKIDQELEKCMLGDGRQIYFLRDLQGFLESWMILRWAGK